MLYPWNRALLTLVFAAFFYAGPATGDTFRCENHKGEIVYSDTPCDKTNYEIIAIELPDEESDDINYEDIEKKVESATKSWFWEMVESIKLFFFLLTADENSTLSEDTTSFECEGKTTCGEMFSCEEAIFYLNHCPNVEMNDEDDDGIPCENHWCQSR